MNIKPFIATYLRKKNSPSSLYDMQTAKGLLGLDSKAPYALINQDAFDGDSEYLAVAIKGSVQRYSRNKEIAIRIYKDFLYFLDKKGISIEIEFPKVSISNDFERLMFIAKYLQDPKNRVEDLSDILWVSSRTIENDLKKLRGDHEGSIQICGKTFKIDDLERRKGHVHFPSTAHPLFLTPNLSQVIVTLKGLRLLSENPLYTHYAHAIASDIWEQLSEYAVNRIRTVLSQLLPEDLAWYESLQKDYEDYFFSEIRCSPQEDVLGCVLDCIKNDKEFFVEYNTGNDVHIYRNCHYIPRTYNGQSLEVNCTEGQIHLDFDKILRTSYTAELLL